MSRTLALYCGLCHYLFRAIRFGSNTTATRAGKIQIPPERVCRE